MRSIATTTLTGAFALALGACGTTFPPPNEHLVTSEAAVRGATEVGAADEPSAALHLKLAKENIAQAKTMMSQDDHRRADFLLSRASAEAELALSLTRAAKAQAEARAAQDEIDHIRQAAR